MKKGFTLIELMVVIVILGILATVFAPHIPQFVNIARRDKVEALTKELGKYSDFTQQQKIKNEIDKLNKDISNSPVTPAGNSTKKTIYVPDFVDGSWFELTYDGHQYICAYEGGICHKSNCTGVH